MTRVLGGRLAWAIWLLGSTFVVYKLVSQTSYGVLNSHIAKSMSLGLAEIGVLGSVYTFAFAAMTIPSGAILDRYGARGVLSVAIGVVALGALVFGRADSWNTLVLGQLLMGLGGAFGFPGAGYITRHWFPLRRFGLMFGLVQSLTAIANALTQGGLGYLLLHLDWRQLMSWGALAGAVLMGCMAALARDPREVLAQSASEERSLWRGLYLALREVLANRQIWIAAIPGGMVFGVLISVAVLWGIKLLMAHGLDETTASTANALLWVGFGLGAPLIAVVVNRLQSFRTPFIGGLAGLLLLVLTLLLAPALTVAGACVLMLLLGLFTGTTMISFTVTTAICRDVVAATAIAVVNMVMFVISGFMISIPAVLMDELELTAANLAAGLWILPGGLVIALACVWIMREAYQRTPAPAAAA
jgi:MFS family permease